MKIVLMGSLIILTVAYISTSKSLSMERQTLGLCIHFWKLSVLSYFLRYSVFQED